MNNEWQSGIIRVSPKEFVPFKENNLIPKIDCSWKISDKEMTIHATSAFFPMAASIVQSIWDPECFTEMKTLNKVATQVGFRELVNGEVDLLISSEPSREQRKKMDESGIHFEEIKIAKEPVVVIVNKANPIDNLSIDELKDIYLSDTTNWKNYGGVDSLINTYQLEDGNGSQTAFSHVAERSEFTDTHHEIITMPEIVDAVAKDESGICYAYATYYTRMYGNSYTKLIKIDGYDYREDEYPVQSDATLFYRSDNKNENIKRISDFLTTNEGKVIVNNSRMV